MPVDRNPVINTPCEQWRPNLVDDGSGNMVPDFSHETKVANCSGGVVPRSLNHDPFREFGGGIQNVQRWLVVVRGTVGLVSGDSIHVLSGKYVGRYRAEIVQEPPNTSLALAQCLRET
jgi:hypothetical protein